jgi:hypothetical protein
VDGERDATGALVIARLNPNRSVYRHSQDTQDRSLKDFIERWMPQGNPQSCVGECAEDITAFIMTWRRPSDGIPDHPVEYFTCPTPNQAYGQRTLRLLTKVEYQRSVGDLVGYTEDVTSRLPDDFNAGTFLSNNTLLVDRTRYTSYITTAERIADNVATRWNAVLSCNPDANCANRLVTELAPRIFRRPLTTDERSTYLAVAQGTTGGRTPVEGMKVALAGMLSSPQFLYRSELGERVGDVYKLTGHEMATYLSYTFVGTTPSAALLAAAGRQLARPARLLGRLLRQLLRGAVAPLLLAAKGVAELRLRLVHGRRRRVHGVELPLRLEDLRDAVALRQQRVQLLRVQVRDAGGLRGHLLRRRLQRLQRGRHLHAQLLHVQAGGLRWADAQR